jgi:hypothetical protein
LAHRFAPIVIGILTQTTEVTVTTLTKPAALLAAVVALCLFHVPARAQFMPGQGGGGDMMTTMAPMLGMMKKKIGQKRFTQLMKTVGPMAVGIMGNGGAVYGGMGSGFGGYGGGGYGVAPPADTGGGFNIGGVAGMSGLGGMGGMGGMEQFMSGDTIQSLIGMASSGRGGRKAKRRHRSAS